MLPLVPANFVDGHDVGVIQLSRRLGLGLKTLHLRTAGQLPRQDHFERHGPVQAYLARPEHDPHAAARDLPLQFVVSKVMN